MVRVEAGQGVLAVIPARGGSKGLPGKNIRPLCGLPMIAWTIDAARQAGIPATAVVVSTDDAAIAEIARTSGASVPFRRPDHLATDEATTLDVLMHAVSAVELANPGPAGQLGWILLLQPTSPLRTAADITAALDLAATAEPDCDSIIAVAERNAEHPRLAKKIDKDGYLTPFLGASLEGIRRQDCRPSAVFNNGAIYLTRRSVLMESRRILGDRARALVMPRERSIDVDDEIDFVLAECLLSRRLAGQAAASAQ